MTIPNLNTSDTFKTWFDRTNTIISEVNGITIHDLKAGDGISLSSASNVFTVSHGSLVTTGVTFTGRVNFTNSVAFSTSPTIDATVVSVSPKTAGITIGNVVRMSGNGLTLAKADSAENAEVLGVVVSETSTANVVAVAGSINNTNYSKTISNILGISGGTLGIGCAYFLDPVVAGGITTIEPVTYGQVSKPIILGISAGLGSIIPYRGIQIEGISAGITAELDNKLIVQIDYSDAALGNLDVILSGGVVKPGDIFLMWSSNQVDVGAQAANIMTRMVIGQLQSAWKIAGKLNNMAYTSCAVWDAGAGGLDLNTNLRGNEFIGFISKVINDDTVNFKIILEITLQGGTFKVDVNDLDSHLWPTIDRSGSIVVNTSNTRFSYHETTFGFNADLIGAADKEKIADIVTIDANTALITVIPQNAILSPGQRTYIQNVITSSIPSSFNFTKNLLLNGKFLIKQRWYDNGTGLGPTMGVYTDSEITAPFTPFIADRWFIVKPPEMTGVTLQWALQDSSTRLVPDRDNVNTSPNNVGFISLKAGYIAPSSPYTGVVAPRLRLENIMLCPFKTLESKATLEFKARVEGNSDYFLRIMTNSYPLPSSYASRLSGSTGLSGDIYIRNLWSTRGLTTSASPTIEVNWTPNQFGGGVTLTNTFINYQVPLLIGSKQFYYKVEPLIYSPVNDVRPSRSYGYNDNEWISVGFELENALGVTLIIGDVRLVPGWKSSGIIEELTLEEEYKECQRYYQRSYYWDTPTRFSNTDSVKKDTFYQRVTFPNPLINSKVWIPFQVTTQRVPSGITLYSASLNISSFNGITGEVFNVSAETSTNLSPSVPALQKKNVPWDTSSLRSTPAAAAGLNFAAANISQNGFELVWPSGAGICEMGDVLQFHYIADADFNPPKQ